MKNGEIGEFFLKLKPVVLEIAETFGPECEVVLHDLSHPKNSVVMVANGDVTGRRVGQTFSELMSILRSPYLKDDKLCNYFKNTENGDIIKSSTALLRGDNGQVVGALCINYSLGKFLQVRKFADDFCKMIDLSQNDDHKEATDLLDEDVSSILHMILSRTISDAGIPVALMTRDDKVDIVRFLDGKEVFTIKGSVDELAKLLNVSRYTIYNYMDEVRNTK